MKKNKVLEKTAALVVLSLGAVVMLFPFLWMFFGSFKPDAEMMASIPTLLPKNFTLEHYLELFKTMNFGVYIRNTLVIVVYAFVGLIISAMAGYGFAKYNFKHKEKWFFVILITMMVPCQILLIPVYLMILKMQLLNTFTGMAVPAMVSGYSIFLFRQFMGNVPTELIESARLDGAGEQRIFWRIALPLTKSALTVQAIITFMEAWNYFLYPLVIATDESRYTLSIAIALLKNESGTNYGLQMAGAALAVIPVLIVFVAFQKNIKDGFVLSGVKG